MIVFLTAIWVYKMMFYERGIHIKPSPLNLPLLAFLVSALISWLIGYVVWDWKVVVEKNILNVQIGQYALFLFSFAAMYLTAHQDLSEKHLKSWLVIIVIIGMGEIALEYFLGIYVGRNNGILGSLFVFPLVLLAAQFLFNPQFSTGGRLATIAAAGIWLLWAYRNLDSKGVWVPALIGLAIVVLIRNWKLTLVGGIAVGIVVFLQWDVLQATLFAPELGSNSMVRPLIWKDIAGMVLPRSPLFGLGLANYFYYWNDPSLIPLSRIAAGWYKWNAWGYAIPSAQYVRGHLCPNRNHRDDLLRVGNGSSAVDGIPGDKAAETRIPASLCHWGWDGFWGDAGRLLPVRGLADPFCIQHNHYRLSPQRVCLDPAGDAAGTLLSTGGEERPGK